MKFSINVGRRATDARLSIEIRSSRGEQHALSLPPEARIDQVAINGSTPLNLRFEEGQLLIPLAPGSQTVTVNWQQTQALGMVTRTPAINLGTQASNLNIELVLPADRWILLTRGPQVGPAVLLWGELLVMILVAWGLGRTTCTPLKFRQWLLLGIGFGAVSWLAFLAVIIWMFVIAWRRDQKADGPRWRFNLMQLALTGFTLAALATLISAIPFGLLGQPDMHIVGNNSYGNTCGWLADGSDGPIQTVSVIAVPLWWYKGAMLAWALWLSSALLGWLPWVWQCLSADRFWIGKVKVAK